MAADASLRSNSAADAAMAAAASTAPAPAVKRQDEEASTPQRQRPPPGAVPQEQPPAPGDRYSHCADSLNTARGKRQAYIEQVTATPAVLHQQRTGLEDVEAILQTPLDEHLRTLLADTEGKDTALRPIALALEQMREQCATMVKLQHQQTADVHAVKRLALFTFEKIEKDDYFACSRSVSVFGLTKTDDEQARHATCVALLKAVGCELSNVKHFNFETAGGNMAGVGQIFFHSPSRRNRCFRLFITKLRELRGTQTNVKGLNINGQILFMRPTTSTIEMVRQRLVRAAAKAMNIAKVIDQFRVEPHKHRIMTADGRAILAQVVFEDAKLSAHLEMDQRVAPHIRQNFEQAWHDLYVAGARTPAQTRQNSLRSWPWTVIFVSTQFASLDQTMRVDVKQEISQTAGVTTEGNTGATSSQTLPPWRRTMGEPAGMVSQGMQAFPFPFPPVIAPMGGVASTPASWG